MSKAVSSFVNTSESAQVALITAAQRGSMYQPRSEEEQAAIAHYWASPARTGDGSEALFTAKLKLPFEEVHSYIINKAVLEYINLLYIGQRDTEPFLSADFETYGSVELKAILENIADDEEFELEGVLKCEALGLSLRDGKINPTSDIVINSNNPMDGAVTFRRGEFIRKEDVEVADEATVEEDTTA